MSGRGLPQRLASPAAAPTGSRPRRVAATLTSLPPWCWKFLAILWAGYYLAVFSVGRYPDLTRPLIWGGGAATVGFTAFAFLRGPHSLPREAWLLWGFALWGLTGLLQLREPDAFFRGLRLAVQAAVLVSMVGIVLRHSGGVKWLCFAFIGSLWFFFLSGDQIPTWEQALADNQAGTRLESELAGNPNGFGFWCFMAVLAALGLYGEIKRRLVWLLLLVAAVLPASYGLVVSASKSAFLITLLALICWPVMCLRVLVRHRAVAHAVLLAVVLAGWFATEFLLQGTFLGSRLKSAARFEERSTQHRFELFLAGLRAFAQSPLFGVGFGQFMSTTGSTHNPHDEWSSLLSATGIVGAGLFLAVYVSVWLRLSRLRRASRNPLLRYRINFARMTILLLVLAGSLFRTNYTSTDSLFLLAMAVGTAEWAARQVRQARQSRLKTAAPTTHDFPVAPRALGLDGRHPAFQPPASSSVGVLGSAGNPL